MEFYEILKKVMPAMPAEIYDILLSKGKIVKFSPRQILLKEGYFVNAVPVVVEGLLKVTRREEDKEILLYYINPGESCIMSFSACITSTASKVFAITETASQILMIPSETLARLIQDYPSFNHYFHNLYQNRYEELIGAIDQLVFMKFDERLYKYLKDRAKKLQTDTLKITHQEIASDTGTVREVVSRALKKLEKDSKLQLTRAEIKIL